MATNRTLPVLLAVAVALAAGKASSCPVLSEPEAIEAGVKEHAESRRLVNEVAARADQIFIARLASANEERLVRESPDGAELSIVRTTATFEILRSLKGGVTGEQAYFWERIDNRIVFGCSGLTHFYEVGSLLPTYRYLIYAREGEVLRANTVVDWFEGLDVPREIELLYDALEP